MKGISKCQKCNRFVIEEEHEIHQCLALIEYKIIGSILWVKDSQRWYPLKLKPDQPKVNTNNTTDKETEPVIRKCYLLGCFFSLLISVGNSGYCTIDPCFISANDLIERNENDQ